MARTLLRMSLVNGPKVRIHLGWNWEAVPCEVEITRWCPIWVHSVDVWWEGIGRRWGNWYKSGGWSLPWKGCYILRDEVTPIHHDLHSFFSSFFNGHQRASIWSKSFITPFCHFHSITSPILHPKFISGLDTTIYAIWLPCRSEGSLLLIRCSSYEFVQGLSMDMFIRLFISFFAASFSLASHR